MAEIEISGGVFHNFYQTISEELKSSGKLDELSAEFAKLKTDEERAKFVLELEIVNETMKIEENFNGKSLEEAKVLRENGNQSFQKKYYYNALQHYNDCIRKVPLDADNPEGKNELALAYGNRSAVLYHLKDYEQSLIDIGLALECGFPPELHFKLYDRQGKCYRELKKKGDAVAAFKKASELLQQSNLDESKKLNWENDIRTQAEACQKLSAEKPKTKDSQKNIYKKPKIPVFPPSCNKNDKFPCASAVFELKDSAEQGRCAVVSKDVRVGEVLIVEKPFGSVLLAPYYMTHCYNCMKRTIGTYPCPNCCTVNFCSKECQQVALDSFHKNECKYLSNINLTDNCWGHLVHRVILRAGYDKLTSFKEYLKNEGGNVDWNKFGCGDGDVWAENDLRTVRSLMTHDSDRTPADLFLRAIKAVFLLKCLQKGGFFGEEAKSEDVVFVGGLLLSLLQLCPCNAHEVSEIEVSRKGIRHAKSLEIGAGLYPTMSLLNHSCNPTVVRHYYGDVCVVRAIRNMRKGEEIVDNYGALWAVHPKKFRQDKLKDQYYFNCQCDACLDDWPIYPEMPDNMPPALKCEKCSEPLLPQENTNFTAYPCTQCKHKHDMSKKLLVLERSHEVFSEAMDKMLKGDVEDALPVFERHLWLMEECLCLPWKDYNNCQEAVKHCYAVMANCKKID
ncbi:SET and MYND domain-containing protein 4-like [Lineus longissimus]|uniref:SET and MYND domain-containing protein 4-like n=1 Tax=Lineus longissimus TaxID=88925 RepID=UPI002B4FA747